MIAIRRIYDHNNSSNQKALAQCKEILVDQFPWLTKSEAEEFFMAAEKSLATQFRSVILVAEGRNKAVIGVAIASYFPESNFYFLDYIATHQNRISGGVGGALYERLREEALSSKAIGIFYDCLSDDKTYCNDEEERKQNIARLKFYERFGARPLEGVKYELPRGDKSIFHLVFDGLGLRQQLKGSIAKSIVQPILEYKAQKKCSPKYIKEVVSSIKSHVTLRPFQYLKTEKIRDVNQTIHADKKISMVINEDHLIHHVRERGYLESPVRVKSILKELNKLSIFDTTPSKHFSDKHMENVHDGNYLEFLKKICESIGSTATRYGDVFPIRNAARLPGDVELQIGYYCIDTSTPLNANAYIAARAAVDCALTAAEKVLDGKHLAYALIRPPGHHAERRHFGGFCYLNSNAIAADYLSKKGKVAILDIDYHHGNGQQNIFYERPDVFTVSIHADPEYAYPNFTGFDDEKGKGDGEGYNLNITLPKGVVGQAYHKALSKALDAIREYQPAFLVIALGLDIAKGDPTGTWLLSAKDFSENGRLIAEMNLPTLVVQEGGYQNRALGINARYFFEGLWEGYYL